MIYFTSLPQQPPVVVCKWSKAGFSSFFCSVRASEAAGFPAAVRSCVRVPRVCDEPVCGCVFVTVPQASGSFTGVGETVPPMASLDLLAAVAYPP